MDSGSSLRLHDAHLVRRHKTCFQPQRGFVLQPNVAAAATLGSRKIEHHINRKAVASVPNVSLIPFDAMPPQQSTQFILESNLPVMLDLISNVSFDLLQIRLAHGKIGISTLPFKIGELEFSFSSKGS